MILFLLWQGVAAVCVSAITDIFWGSAVAKSALWGGLIALVPNIVLAVYFFSRSHHHPKKMLRDIYIGELLKVLMIGASFVVVLHYFDVALLPFLVGLCGVYAVYFAAQLIMS